jgi:molecular chaperone DnaK
MVKDAEANAAEDHKAVELATARNAADSMVHSVKKSLAEYGDKVSADEKAAIEAALKECEEAVREGDKDIIEAKTNALATASHKLAEQMYQAEQAKAQPGAAPGGGAGAADDNVVDAEFEEVKDK